MPDPTEQLIGDIAFQNFRALGIGPPGGVEIVAGEYQSRQHTELREYQLSKILYGARRVGGQSPVPV